MIDPFHERISGLVFGKLSDKYLFKECFWRKVQHPCFRNAGVLKGTPHCQILQAMSFKRSTLWTSRICPVSGKGAEVSKRTLVIANRTYEVRFFAIPQFEKREWQPNLVLYSSQQLRPHYARSFLGGCISSDSLNA